LGLTGPQGTTGAQGSSGGAGTGGSGQTLVIKVDYTSNGAIASVTKLSGSGSAIATNSTATVCEVTFTLTDFTLPPTSIISYGYARAANTYIPKHVEGTFTNANIAAGGSSGSPTAFTNFAAGTHKLKLNLTTGITLATVSGSPAGQFPTTHCVVVITGI
jgi:hypothetical protein